MIYIFAKNLWKGWKELQILTKQMWQYQLFKSFSLCSDSASGQKNIPCDKEDI